MVPDPSAQNAIREVQRKSYFNGAACLLGAVALHCLIIQDMPVELVAFQVGAASIYVLLGLSLRAGWFQSEQLGVVSAIVGLISGLTLVHFSGGPLSPYYQVFGALPFLLALFTPGSRLPTLVSGGAALVAVLFVGVLAHRPLPMLLLQAVSSGTLLWLALFGTQVYRRMIEQQQEAHRERLEALERLAESERLRGRAERERAEVERLVLVGQLAAGVAHEVNNPLAYVKANLAFLQRDLELDRAPMERDELRALVDETQQGVARIQQIISDLKGFTRASQSADDQMGGGVEEALYEASRLASVRLAGHGDVSLELPPGLPAVSLDQRHLVQVGVNLLLNAADAVEEAEPKRRARITVRATCEADGVCLRVEDNGPGIPPEVLPRIFDSFFTTKPPGKGTGLGLALCREYVSRAGGSLSAENRSEGGARFILRLPLAPGGEART